MNSKYIANVVIGACLAGVIAWWWSGRSTPMTGPAPHTHAAEAENAGAPTAVPPAVASDLASAPDAGRAEPLPAAVDPTPALVSDPQADMSTAVPDLIRLAQAGNFAAVYQMYVPPDVLAKMSPDELAMRIQRMQTAAQTPAGQMQMQAMLATPPTYDDTGTHATIALPAGSPSGDTMTFVKVNGRWYVQ